MDNKRVNGFRFFTSSLSGIIFNEISTKNKTPSLKDGTSKFLQNRCNQFTRVKVECNALKDKTVVIFKMGLGILR